MPIHDWTRVDAELFHAFHRYLIVSILIKYNNIFIIFDYFALADLSFQGPIPDALTLRIAAGKELPLDLGQRALAVADALPRARFVLKTEVGVHARKTARGQLLREFNPSTAGPGRRSAGGRRLHSYSRPNPA